VLERVAIGRRVCVGVAVAMVAAWASAAGAHADAPRQRYIVTYRSLTTAQAGPVAAARTAAALPSDGSQVVRSYATLPSVAVDATEVGREQLAASPGVVSVTLDRDLHATAADDGQTAPDDATLDTSAPPPVTGAGWTVAIVDTGVDTSHPYLAGRTGTGFDGHGDIGACFADACPGGGATGFGLAAAQPCPAGGCEHGTHVAGIALGSGAGGPGGVAPGAGLYPVRVFSTTSSGGATAHESDVLAALDHIMVQAAHYHFAAVNMSLGGDTTFAVPCAGLDPDVEAAIQRLSGLGVAVTVASGNHSSPTGIAFPACATGAVSVGALDSGGLVANFSDAVTGLSLVAPGTRIVSSVPGGGFAEKSGTSMAAPAVAGAFALAREAAPTAGIADLLNVFRSTATPAPDLRPSAAGASYPALNLVAALAALGRTPPGFTPANVPFHGLPTPQRLVDTRTGVGGARLTAGGTLTVTISGVNPSGAETPAASLNVTSVGADGPGFLTVFPCEQAPPLVSSVNYAGPTPVANKVVLAVPSTRQVCIFSMTATDVVVDMDGWLASAKPFVPLAPSRKADTRASGVRVNGDIAVPVVPPGAGGAVVNLTITQPVADGFATLYPCGARLPLASNVNFLAGGTAPAAALVPVDTAGRVCVHTSTPAHVVVDVFGWLSTGFAPTGPTRVLDTRTAGSFATDVSIAPAGGAGAGGVALTLTVVEPTAPGFATVFPCGQPPPLASNVNFVAGQIVANAVIAASDAAGRVCVHTSTPTHLVIDVSGFFR
jgi:subtilisin family serine protease